VFTPELPTFDLVVASVDRVDELEGLLASLETQTYRGFRVLLVDQNDDDRLDRVVAKHGSLEITRLRAPRGLSRARNAALANIRADLVGFPDDDCAYPAGLLADVARRLAAGELDGLTGRAADAAGRSSPSWPRDEALLTRANFWNRGISYAIFLRRHVIERVGTFDERLGLGAQTPWSSGEETDYLVRAIDAGFRIAYDPDLVVLHELRDLSAAALRTIGYRDGASVGYLLRKHGFGPRAVAGMLARPLVGTALSLARGDLGRARFHLATWRGRLRGYVRGTVAPG
jgi:glycosyltransferase involved in cell wall biosynthesis